MGACDLNEGAGGGTQKGAPGLGASGQGVHLLEGGGWTARVLGGAPLITPARQYVFPLRVPGEEEAMARGSVWVAVSVRGGGSYVAQCAIGFAAAGVAEGLWPLPDADELLVVAGGYAYAVDARVPERTEWLAMRPVVGVVEVGSRLVLMGHHAVLVREADRSTWVSERLSWEGVAVTGKDGDVLRGTGWDMMADEDVPFALDLRTRIVTGGGFSRG